MRRVVVLQGQYGFFSVSGLSFSMPAVQTCIGLFGLSYNGQYMLAAHFDTDKSLRENICSIIEASESIAGMHLNKFKLTVFGGDGVISYLRCGTPSVHIGESIINELKRRGVNEVIYDPLHYSGVIPYTYNLNYLPKSGFVITKGRNQQDFIGVSRNSFENARVRIKKKPEQYSKLDALMYNISFF